MNYEVRYWNRGDEGNGIRDPSGRFPAGATMGDAQAAARVYQETNEECVYVGAWLVSDEKENVL